MCMYAHNMRVNGCLLVFIMVVDFIIDVLVRLYCFYTCYFHYKAMKNIILSIHDPEKSVCVCVCVQVYTHTQIHTKCTCQHTSVNTAIMQWIWCGYDRIGNEQ